MAEVSWRCQLKKRTGLAEMICDLLDLRLSTSSVLLLVLWGSAYAGDFPKDELREAPGDTLQVFEAREAPAQIGRTEGCMPGAGSTGCSSAAQHVMCFLIVQNSFRGLLVSVFMYLDVCKRSNMLVCMCRQKC